MVNYTDIFILKSKLNKLKHELNNENKTFEEKQLANKYLNKVFDYVNELQLY